MCIREVKGHLIFTFPDFLLHKLIFSGTLRNYFEDRTWRKWRREELGAGREAITDVLVVWASDRDAYMGNNFKSSEFDQFLDLKHRRGTFPSLAVDNFITYD
jgi:hypothetical protein